jgi:hypothetical protein
VYCLHAHIYFALLLPLIFAAQISAMQRDTAIFDLIHEELERQRHGIELIASENFTSLQVMEAMGKPLRINMRRDIWPSILWWL